MLIHFAHINELRIRVRSKKGVERRYLEHAHPALGGSRCNRGTRYRSDVVCAAKNSLKCDHRLQKLHAARANECESHIAKRQHLVITPSAK